MTRGRHRRSRSRRGWWTLAGVIVVAAGAFLVVRGLTEGRQLPPAAAQQVPASVKSTVPGAPGPDAVTAAPLASSRPVMITIRKILVDAPVNSTGETDGVINLPPLSNHNLAVWWDGSVTPGQDGTSVILGHVDSYQGISVFYYIKDLVKGNLVDVTLADGSVARFAVDGVQEVPKASFPAGEVYGNEPYPALRLITCGGPFDASTGQYLDNIIVYAHLVSST